MAIPVAVLMAMRRVEAIAEGRAAPALRRAGEAPAREGRVPARGQGGGVRPRRGCGREPFVPLAPAASGRGDGPAELCAAGGDGRRGVGGGRGLGRAPAPARSRARDRRGGARLRRAARWSSPAARGSGSRGRPTGRRSGRSWGRCAGAGDDRAAPGRAGAAGGRRRRHEEGGCRVRRCSCEAGAGARPARRRLPRLPRQERLAGEEPLARRDRPCRSTPGGSSTAASSGRRRRTARLRSRRRGWGCLPDGIDWRDPRHTWRPAAAGRSPPAPGSCPRHPVTSVNEV